MSNYQFHLSNVTILIHSNNKFFEQLLYFCNIIHFDKFEDAILYKPLAYYYNTKYKNIKLYTSFHYCNSIDFEYVIL